MTKLKKSSGPKKSPTGDLEIGGYIKTARKQAKKTQEALADELGVSKGLIAQWELGQTMPTIPALLKLSKALHAPVDRLLRGGRALLSHQEVLAGLSLDDRIAALPEGLREFVLLSLQRAEHAQRHIPAKFINPPTSENWPEFAAYLEAISIIGTQKRDQ